MELTYSGAIIRRDDVGGERVYVCFQTESGEEHAVPVTEHLHNMTQFGSLTVETVRELVGQELSDLTITDDCVHTAIQEVTGLLRQRKLVAK